MFWLLALFSNSSSGAFSAVIQWSTSSVQLPPEIVLIGQVSGTFGYLAGTAFAILVGRRWRSIEAVLVSTSLEIVACLPALIIGWAHRSGEMLEIRAAAILAMATALFAFASGIGGPSWIALVYNWGDESWASRIHWDSVQFNMGRMIGPYIGAQFLVNLHAALFISAILNCLSFSFVLLFVVLRLRGSCCASVENLDNEGSREVTEQAKNTVLALFLASFSVAVLCEGGRGYLARWLQVSGESPGTYSAISFMISLSAALASFWMAKNKVLFGYPVAIGASFCVASFALWICAGHWWTGWLLGGVLSGLGASLTYGAISATLMAGRSDADARYISSLQLIVRSVGAVVGAGIPVAWLEGGHIIYWLAYCLIIAIGIVPLWIIVIRGSYSPSLRKSQ
ncbi:hypothetical protein NSA19_13580 [Actinomyces bowdenii]|uniref:hypothetical protein n=1 Tax=Actinomyces bowdenii TaxID=131109 RepID=UPI00214CD132|nr:hypothetical protein [Actinomyces bowdenii]MCR2053848.1 hypothetical protein [Actinomyces bowdenii]